MSYSNTKYHHVISHLKRRLQKPLAALAALLLASSAFANPVVDNVAHGNVSIQQTVNTTTVNQTSQKAIINWQSFNINRGEHTHFNQPNGGVTLNRINPAHGASQIWGQLSATGKIILVNPAGIYIRPNAFINVGGLIASTAGITDQNFLNGIYKFDQTSSYNGMVINKGTIIAAEHGLVALMGNAVSNEGYIEANLGTVVIGAGRTFTMSFAGNDMISFAVDEGIMQRSIDSNGNSVADGISNTGTIKANGGRVLIHAKAAGNILDHVINMKGIVQSNSVHNINGEIYLAAGNNTKGLVRIAGKMSATGMNAGEKGGVISISGYNVLIDNDAILDASGDLGAGNIRIGGNYLGNGPIPNADRLIMMHDAKIYANALTNGNGGEVILWSNDYTQVFGSIFAKGGTLGGNGGFVETSGKNNLRVGESFTVDTSAAAGTVGKWLLDPKFIVVATGGTATLTDVDEFSDDPTNTVTITPATINAALASVILQANTDITISNAINMTESGIGINLQAGRDIFVNANIITNNGAISMTANDDNALIADRDAGTGNITFGAVTLNSGSAATTLTIGSSNAAPFAPGFILIGGTTSITGNGGVTFNGEINSTGGNRALTVNSSGSTFFSSTIGQTLALSTLTLNAGGSTTINGNVTTTGTQSYGDALTVGANITLAGANVNTNAIDTNGFALTVDVSGNSNLGGTISGSGSIIKLGAGTMGLQGYNTHTGGITLNAGTLYATNNDSLGLGTLTLNGGLFGTSWTSHQRYNNDVILGANATIGGAQVFYLQGIISGNNALTVNSSSGTNTIILTRDNTFTGGVILNNGVLSVSHNNALGTGTLTVNNGTIAFNNSVVGNAITLGATAIISRSGAGNTTLNGVISGSNGLTKVGTGAITLSGANDYTGITAINGGTLVANNVSALGTTADGTIVADGATLRVDGVTISSEEISAIGTGVSSAGAIQGANTAAINSNITMTGATSFGSTGTLTINGVIDGAFALTKVGAGTLVLSNANTYTDTTTISAGTLVVNNADALGTTAAGTIITNGTLRVDGITLNSEAISVTGAGISSAGAIQGANTAVINSNITMTGATSFGGTDTLTINGVIDGAFALTKVGTGTLVLSNANTYTGATTITSGTVSINTIGTSGTDTSLGNSADAISIGATGVLEYTGSGHTTTRGITLTASGGTVSASGTGTLTLAGDITGNARHLVLTGTGAGQLDGAVATTTGNITKNGAGTWTIAGTNTNTGSTTINDGTLQIGTGSTSGALGGSGSIINSAALIINRSDTYAMAHLISGTGTFTQAGAGTTIFTGANTYSGDTFINAGALQIGNNGIAGQLGTTSVVTNNADLIFNRTNSMTVANTINGTGTVTQSGTGTTILTGSNTYSGITTINAGTLQIGNNGTTGTLGTNNVVNNATLSISRSNAYTVNNAISGTGALIKVSAGTTTLTGANSYDGLTTISAGILQIGEGNTSGTLGLGNVTNSAALIVNRSDAYTMANVMSGTGTFTQAGAGTTTLTGNNTYSGITTISAGTLQIGNNGTTGTLGTNNVVNNAALSINRSDAYTVNNAISGSGELIKAGAGTTTLTGTNSYAGTTTISAGALQIGSGGTTGTLGTGDVINNSVLSINRSNAYTINNAISGTGGLFKDGNGALTLTGNNTYTGETNIYLGTLIISDITNIGGTSHIRFSNIGTLQTSNTFTINVPISIDYEGSGTIAVNSGTLTLGTNATVSGDDFSWLNLTGSGAIVLNGVIGDSSSLEALVSNIATTIGANITTRQGYYMGFPGGPDRQTFNNTVTLGANVTLSSEVGAIDFNGGVLGAAYVLDINKTSGTVTFANGQTVTLGGLTTNAGAYTVSMLGTTNTFTNAVTFNNTSGVTLGNGSDTFNFNGGLTSTASTTTLNATVNTTADDVILGTTTVAGNSSILTAGGAITLGTTNSSPGTNNLTINSDTGALTLGGAITSLANFTAINSGAGNNIAITNNISAATAINLTSGGSVSSTGILSTGTLTTAAVDGITLNSNNTVNVFNATNTTNGGVSLLNTATTLTVSGISQTGVGDVSINNTGAINLTGALAAGASNNINLTSTTAITDTGAGLVSGATLTTASGTGTTLNGANAVTGFTATNSTSGNILLVNTATLLTVGAVTASGSGNISLTNAGSMTVNGNITAASGNVTLVANGNGNMLTLNNNVTSTNGSTSYTANHMTLIGTTTADVGAELRSIGNVTVNLGGDDSGSSLGITDAELDTITAPSIYILSDLAMSISAAINPAGTDTLFLESDRHLISQSAPLTITNLRLRYDVGSSLTNSGNAISNIAVMVNNPTGNGVSIRSTLPLNVTTILGFSGIIAGGAVSLNAPGITISSNITAGTITSLTSTGGAITQQTGTAITTSSLRVTNTSANTTLNSTANNIANLDTINAAGNTFTLVNNRAAGMTQSGALTAGTLVLTNTAGTTSLTHASNAVSTLGNINTSGQIFNFANSIALTQNASTTINANIFTLSGSGTTTLDQANVFSTGVTLNSGTLLVGTTTAIDTGTLTLNGGTFGTSINGLTIANAISLGGNATIGGSNNFTLSGVINGSNTLNKAGVNQITLSGDNTYTGLTTVSNGTLIGTDVNAFGTGSAGISITPTASATATLDLSSLSAMIGNTGNIILNSSAASSNAQLLLDNNYTFNKAIELTGANNTISQNSGSKTINGIISGTGALTKAGAGTLILNNMNTYSGTTNINAGTLAIDNANNIGSSSNITFGGGTLRTDAALTLSHNITLNAGGGTLNANNSTLILNGTINGANALTLNGAGTGITLNGIVGGSTAITSLTSNIATTLSANMTSTGAITFNAPVTLNNDVTSRSLNGNVAIYNTVNGAHTFTMIADQGQAIIGGHIGNITPVTSLNISGAAGIEFTGSNITSSGNQTYTGPITVNGNTTLSLTDADNLLTVNTGSNQTFNINGTNAGNIANPGSYMLNFTGAESISGSVTNNTFMMYNNGNITGTIFGSINGDNTINYTNLTTPVNLYITTTNVNNGYFNTGLFSNIDYENIDLVIGNAAFDNRITVPNINGKHFTVVYTGYRKGYIGDPIFFENFTVNSNTPTPVTPTTPTNPTNIASIIEQPDTNKNDDQFNTTSPIWSSIDPTFDLAVSIEILDKMTLSNVKATTNCSSPNTISKGIIGDNPTEEELLNAIKYKMTKSVKEQMSKSMSMNK